MSSEHNIGSRL